MTCNNCNCQCNDEKYYQEWVPNTQYSVGDFFRIKNEVYKAISRNEPIGLDSCGNRACEFLRNHMEHYCDYTPCVIFSRKLYFILYDTLDENEYES